MNFQWDNGNLVHIVDEQPIRGNTTSEVESLFYDPNFAAIPDRVDKNGEQQYNAVALSNLNRVLYVVFSIRNEEIRPISCRPASRKERKRYGQIIEEKQSNGITEEGSSD